MDGEYYLVKTDILAHTMSFSSSKDTMSNLITIPTSRVREIIAMNRAGKKVESLIDKDSIVTVEEPTFRTEEDSITRFDNQNKRRKNRNKGNRQRPQQRGEARSEENRTEEARTEGNREPKENREPREGRAQRSNRGSGNDQQRNNRHNQRKGANPVATQNAPEGENSVVQASNTPKPQEQSGEGQPPRENRNGGRNFRQGRHHDRRREGQANREGGNREGGHREHNRNREGGNNRGNGNNGQRNEDRANKPVAKQE